VVTALNELGNDGWELVNVDSPSNLSTLLYLKREIVG
jgi:hypothetical protein